MTLFGSLLLCAVSAVSAIRTALDSSASWQMDRQLSGSRRVLKTWGTVRCEAKRGITWAVTRPFESSVSMTTNAMVFTDEEGRREKALADLPFYAEFQKATDAFVAGDQTAFDAIFNWEETASEEGGWRVKLTPRVRALRQLLSEIELSGAALPTNAVLTAGDGSRSVIRFGELRRDE